MSTETPRTEDHMRLGHEWPPISELVHADFARQLERELTACKLAAEDASSAVGMLERENAELRGKLNRLIAACSTPYGSGVKQPSIYDLVEAGKPATPNPPQIRILAPLHGLHTYPCEFSIDSGATWQDGEIVSDGTNHDLETLIDNDGEPVFESR